MLQNHALAARLVKCFARRADQAASHSRLGHDAEHGNRPRKKITLAEQVRAKMARGETSRSSLREPRPWHKRPVGVRCARPSMAKRCYFHDRLGEFPACRLEIPCSAE